MSDGTHGQVLILVFDGIGHLVGCDAQRLHGGRLQVKVDFTFGATHQRDRTDATHVLQSLLEHLLGPVGDLHGREVFPVFAGFRNHCERPDGPAGRVKAQDLGFLDFGAQAGANSSHFFAHILGGLAAIHVQLELDDHDRLVLVAARSQGIDAGDRVDRFFNLFGDFALDDFG